MLEVDDVQFTSTYERVPVDQVARILDGWLERDAWIVDGWGPPDAIERRFAAADAIVHVDFPLARHLWWTAKRQLVWSSAVRERAPTVLMFRTIVRVHRQHVPRIRARLEAPDLRDKTVRLRSPREVRGYLENARA